MVVDLRAGEEGAHLAEVMVHERGQHVGEAVDEGASGLDLVFGEPDLVAGGRLEDVAADPEQGERSQPDRAEHEERDHQPVAVLHRPSPTGDVFLERFRHQRDPEFEQRLGGYDPGALVARRLGARPIRLTSLLSHSRLASGAITRSAWARLLV